MHVAAPPAASERTGALREIKVLDLSRFIAGPLCAQYLADMGAEVIKVERPGGEDARGFEPRIRGESLYVMHYNRNKLGVTLDTRHPAALELLQGLVARADVLVENYRPGTLASMGLSPEVLHELNPDLVVTSLSGFGQTGPLAQRSLFDAIAQAMSGLMARTGDVDAPPTLAGAFIADYLTGIHGALGTVTALLARSKGAGGQLVDVASLDSLFATLGMAPSAFLELGLEPQRTGARDAISGPANAFPTADGWIYMHAGTDPLFRRLAAAMGRPELTEGAWRDVAGRMADVEQVEAEVGLWLRGMTTDEASTVLDRAGIPFGPVHSVADVVEHEQIAARSMMVPTPHTSAGTVRLPGLPIKLSGTPGSIRHGAPDVGEHNDYVYGELLGLDTARIAELRATGAI